MFRQMKDIAQIAHQNLLIATLKLRTLIGYGVSVLIHLFIVFIFISIENSSLLKVYSLNNGLNNQLKSRSMTITKKKEHQQRPKLIEIDQKSPLQKKARLEKQLHSAKNQNNIDNLNDVTSSQKTTGENSILAKYLHEVRQTIVKNKFKNSLASKLHLKGAVEVAFVISEVNEIKALKILNSSGHPPLDQSAIQTIKNISEFSKLPENVAKSDLAISVVIEFL